MISWEDYQYEYRDIGTDGPHYLSINRRYLPLDRKTGSQGYIWLMGTYSKSDITLGIQPSVNGTAESISSDEVKNDRFHARVVENGGSLSVVVTTRGEYSKTDPAQNKDILVIRAGRIEFTVNLEQKTPTWSVEGDDNIEL
ncbi:MAG: hypothetical protein LUD15_02580 [Bacteroides sp.]|nr:hypothetical protein [Bacteroides sp.]